MRYKCWRSADVELHLVCFEDGFNDLHHRIRSLGPWTGSREGEVANLQPHYRRLLEEQRFVLIFQKPSAFHPEHP